MTRWQRIYDEYDEKKIGNKQKFTKMKGKAIDWGLTLVEKALKIQAA